MKRDNFPQYHHFPTLLHDATKEIFVFAETFGIIAKSIPLNLSLQFFVLSILGMDIDWSLVYFLLMFHVCYMMALFPLIDYLSNTFSNTLQAIIVSFTLGCFWSCSRRSYFFTNLKKTDLWEFKRSFR